MPIKSASSTSYPFAVEAILDRIGDNLKTARLRRRMTMAEVAGRLGVDRRSIAAMERGQPQSSIGLIIASLWIYGLEQSAIALGDPDKDTVGRGLEERARPKVARKAKEDDDF